MQKGKLICLSVGIWAYWVAQIGAHVGSPLRQNPKTRVPNIAIKNCNIQTEKCTIESCRHENPSDTLSLISFLFALGFPSTNLRIWSVNVGEVLDFVTSSLDRHKHKARGKRAGSLIPLQRRYTRFYLQNLRDNTLETLWYVCTLYTYVFPLGTIEIHQSDLNSLTMWSEFFFFC